MGIVEEQIRKKIQDAIKPLSFEIENESDSHSGPKGRESHFKVLVISDYFKNKTRVERQREVMDLLAEELKTSVHALSLRLLTSDEAHKRGFKTPDCSHNQ